MKRLLPVERRASRPAKARHPVSIKPCHIWFPTHRSRTIRTMIDSLVIAGRQFRSRLIVGTGKYKSFQETARALEASGADMVTVAVRRVNLDRSKESLLDYIDPKNISCCRILPAAIRPMTPSARRDWRAKSASPTGSSSK